VSEVQQGPGWWRASDGKWYPPQAPVEPLPPPPPYAYAPPPRRSVSSGLGGTVQGFSWAVAALALISGLLALVSLTAFNTYWDTPINSRAEDRAYDDWVSIDDGFAAFAGFALLVGFVLWILLTIWMNSAHKTTQQLWHGDRKWSSGWTVGGWFIPVAGAIIPKLVISEIERIALAPRAGGFVADPSWTARSTLLVGKIWWVGFVLGTIVNGVGNTIGTDLDSSSGDVQASYILNAIGFACIGVSGVGGAFYVRRLTKRLSADGLRQEP
jgi:Domain of unknown function (DUF4328)